jgi:hypothetical protein
MITAPLALMCWPQQSVQFKWKFLHDKYGLQDLLHLVLRCVDLHKSDHVMELWSQHVIRQPIDNLHNDFTSFSFFFWKTLIKSATFLFIYFCSTSRARESYFFLCHHMLKSSYYPLARTRTVFQYGRTGNRKLLLSDITINIFQGQVTARLELQPECFRFQA